MVEPKSTRFPAEKPRQTYRERAGEGPQGLDHADPHPAEAGDPYDTKRTRGQAPKKDIGPNPAVHNGTAPAAPDNVTTHAQDEQ